MPETPTLLVLAPEPQYAVAQCQGEEVTACIEECLSGNPSRLDLLAGPERIPAGDLVPFGMSHRLSRDVGEADLPHVLCQLFEDARAYARAHGAPYALIGELEHLELHTRCLCLRALLMVRR